MELSKKQKELKHTIEVTTVELTKEECVALLDFFEVTDTGKCKEAKDLSEKLKGIGHALSQKG